MNVRGRLGPVEPARKTLLVVDDSRTIRTAVAWTLRGLEFEVVECGSAAEARARALARRPDVILLDVLLGEEDGLSLCRAMKDAPALAGVPILMLASGLAPPDDARVAAAGADGVVRKPFDTQTLIDLVRTHAGLPLLDDVPLTYAGRLARQKLAESLRARAVPPPQPSSAPPEHLDVPIDEEEPIELDAAELDGLEATPSTTRDPTPEAVSLPTGPSLEPPPAPGSAAPPPKVDVWALVEPAPLARAADGVAEVAAQRLPSDGLSRDELRALAREVLEEIAWEVVPDLAETIIREELARLLAAR